VTLAEVLRDQGYRTGAVVAAYVLHSRYGLDQGFEFYDDDASAMQSPSRFAFAERNAEAVTDTARRWLDQVSSEPFFLWVHYFDPHSPYEAPGSAEGQVALGAPYDLEIAYADRQFGRLLQAASAVCHSAKRPLLIIATADHGESLWNHGEPTHGLFVYDDTIRVPLIVVRPDMRPRSGLVVQSPVSLVDIYPSVLAWLGLESPYPVDGRVLPVAAQNSELGTRNSHRALYFATYVPLHMYGWSPLEGIVSGSIKYIRAPTPELYDLAADRREQDNLYSISPEQAAELAARLEAVKRVSSVPSLKPGRVSSDPESLRQLRALGYAGAGIEPQQPQAPLESLADPKDRVDLHREMLDVQNLIDEGAAAAALERLRGVLAQDPKNLRVLLLLLDLLGTPRVREEAIDLVFERLKHPPPAAFHQVAQANLALALAQCGRFDEARRRLRQSIEVNPQAAHVNRFLAGALAAVGGARDLPADARRDLEEPEKFTDETIGYALLFAQWCEAFEKDEPALDMYEKLIDVRPEEPLILNNAAWACYRHKRHPDRALAWSRRVVASEPGVAAFRHTLGCVLLWNDQPAEAIEQLEQAAALDEHHAAACYDLARAREAAGKALEAAAAYEQALARLGDQAAPWADQARARLAALRSP
jgi:arylsulfatase A-like enzyme/Tfp pilus assembly protein PilF